MSGGAHERGPDARYRENVTAHAARVSMMALAPGPIGVL
jgi:hypothetical protein